MRLPSNHGAEARVVVVEDDRRRLAEASDEIAADSGGMHSDESDVLFLGFMPQSSPSSSIKTGRSHKGEQQAAVPPQSPRPCPSDRAQSSIAAVLPCVVMHAGVARTESRSPCQADRTSSLNLAITIQHESERTQASYGSGDQWSGSFFDVGNMKGTNGINGVLT